MVAFLWKFTLISSGRFSQLTRLILSIFPKKNWNIKAVSSENNLVFLPCLKGMTVLDRNAFKKVISVPSLKVDATKIQKIMKNVKPFLLKMRKFIAIQDNPDSKTCKIIFLNPLLIKDWNDFQQSNLEVFERLGISKSDLVWQDLEIGYDNWKAKEVFKAVLPDGVTFRYRSIGHIVLLNLKDSKLPYRFLIGQVLLDKLSGVSLVINKEKPIENVYRTFKREIVAGSGSTVATVKEHRTTYKLDVAEVYWNRKLCRERERITKKLKGGDYVFDVFAGVGPFSIPAGKKNCVVHANELNPHCFKWLQENIILNKVTQQVQAYNMDGKQFIQETIKQTLIEIWEQFNSGDGENIPNIHIVMHLPLLATEFLKYFSGLCIDYTNAKNCILPIVHCYSIIKNETNCEEAAIKKVEEGLNTKLDCSQVEVFNVKGVSRNKEMMRVSFKLPLCILFSSKFISTKRSSDESLQENNCKKSCICNE